MGIVHFAICCLAAYLLKQPDTQTIFYVAAVNAGINLWSYGVMYNFRDEPMMAPTSWSNINMLTTIVGIGLLVYSFFI